MAVQAGVSSKKIVENRPRGAGLDIISGFMEKMGKLEIVSGSAHWVQDFDGKKTVFNLDFIFPGTYLLPEIDIEFKKNENPSMVKDFGEIQSHLFGEIKTRKGRKDATTDSDAIQGGKDR
jgi:hypothetical protein